MIVPIVLFHVSSSVRNLLFDLIMGKNMQNCAQPIFWNSWLKV